MKYIAYIMVALLSFVGAIHTAHAAAYPAKPIQVIVPFAAGGGTDTQARLLLKHVEERLGKPMVIVSAYMPPPDPAKRLGFLKDRLEVPEDFDAMGKADIQVMFEGAE